MKHSIDVQADATASIDALIERFESPPITTTQTDHRTYPPTISTLSIVMCFTAAERNLILSRLRADQQGTEETK